MFNPLDTGDQWIEFEQIQEFPEPFKDVIIIMSGSNLSNTFYNNSFI